MPLEIRIRTDEDDTSALPGIFHVDEEKLNQCDDETWLKLKNAGAIPFIYGQILSLGNIQKMGTLLQAESKDKELIDNESLNFLFDKEDDNLNFSAL